MRLRSPFSLDHHPCFPTVRKSGLNHCELIHRVRASDGEAVVIIGEATDQFCTKGCGWVHCVDVSSSQTLPFILPTVLTVSIKPQPKADGKMEHRVVSYSMSAAETPWLLKPIPALYFVSDDEAVSKLTSPPRQTFWLPIVADRSNRGVGLRPMLELSVA